MYPRWHSQDGAGMNTPTSHGLGQSTGLKVRRVEVAEKKIRLT